ncbi:MAG: chemotaxis protein CheA [Desulfobulbaceae bacterium]|nr:chemotaxis protein CheA [Desulfobulbaceae bacterium]HIJ78092.1 chemotaxis protein CheA [Deltaproteobacteria bacterium]
MGNKEYVAIFREETAELLDEIESSLLELEKDPSDLMIVGRIFRAMHTIKGSGAMFGFDAIADFTHHFETMLDKVRDGKASVTSDLIDLTLASCDYIHAMLDADGETVGDNVDPEVGEKLIASLQKLVGGHGEGDAGGENSPLDDCAKKSPSGQRAPVQDGGEKASAKEINVHYRISLLPTMEFFSGGNTVEQLIDELSLLGECTVFQHPGNKVDGGAGDNNDAWEILLTTDRGTDAVEDVFVFARSSCNISVTVLVTEDENHFAEHQKLGEILIARGDISPDDLSRVLAKQKRIGDLLVEEHLVSRSKVDAALVEQQMLQQASAKVGQTKTADSIRVAAEKLDQLINLVGELVVNQARLTQVSSKYDDPGLVEPVEEVERLTAELRDCVLNIRMLPIGTTFARFKRLVRDLSAELGKEVVLVTEGGETELDKNVIDQLGEPMIHLIRNCIDHGMETPADREAKGKPRKGTVRLSAEHAGANVVISVTDDGKGLDVEKILQKGIEKGLVRAGEDLSQKEIFNSIFMPGLSTAATVSSVSGRGVGMDVVKTTIERLKGSVCVAESVKNKGTTITITLPLTLAIIDGLLVLVEDTYLVLPLTQVEECVELTKEDIDHFHDRRMIPVRDQLVPYVRLRDFFAIPGKRPEIEQMVIVMVNGERFGLVLDDVIGEHQTVLKSLGWVYRNAIGLSGSTVLGNGEVALIIDVPDIMKVAQKEEKDVFAD